MISLRSKDEQIIKIPRNSLRLSLTLTNMVQNLNLSDEALESTVIPILAVDAKTLVKVTEFMIENADAPLVSDLAMHKRFVLSEKEKQFLDLPDEDLMNILTAANYLEIPNLINVITQKIADMIEGKTIEEMREFFMIPNDMSTDEMKQSQMKYSWADYD